MEINYVVVLGAAVASFLVGWLWHSNLLFGKVWMRLAGMPEEMTPGMKAKGMQSMAIGFVVTIVEAYVLAYFLALFIPLALSEALYIGLLAWVGFIVPMLIGGVLWEGKSWRIFFFSAIYRLVEISIMSSVLFYWL